LPPVRNSRWFRRRPTGTARSPLAALGHYVLADVASRRGRPDEAAREAALGHALEARR